MLIAFGIQLVVNGYAVRGEHSLDFFQYTFALFLVWTDVGIRDERIVEKLFRHNEGFAYWAPAVLTVAADFDDVVVLVAGCDGVERDGVHRR